MGVGKRNFYKMVYAYILEQSSIKRGHNHNAQAKVRSTFKSDWTKISVAMSVYVSKNIDKKKQTIRLNDEGCLRSDLQRFLFFQCDSTEQYKTARTQLHDTLSNNQTSAEKLELVFVQQ